MSSVSDLNNYDCFNEYSSIKYRATELCHRMDGQINPNVVIDMNIVPDVYAFGEPASATISIPYLFLFKSSDIPFEFRIADAKDPRLQLDDFLQRVANWSKGCMGAASAPLTFEEKEVLRIFLKFFSDPILSEKAKEFVLSHEISHIYFRHAHESYSALQMIQYAIFSKHTVRPLLAAVGATAGIAWGIGASIATGAIGMIASSTAYVAFMVFQSSQESCACEREADLNAVRVSRDAAEGGIYLFEVMRDHYKSARYTNFLTWLLYSPSGDFRPRYLTHPSENERIGYLKEHLYKR